MFRPYLRVHSFSPYLGIGRTGGGGSPKGWVHNLLMQFFTLGSSKIEVFETYFSATVVTQNDHPRYVKHVLGRIYVGFFHILCVCCLGWILCEVALPKAIEFSCSLAESGLDPAQPW